jgi:repressor LexA
MSPNSQNKDYNLTPRQIQVLQALANAESKTPCPTSIRDLATALEINAATAFGHVSSLREKRLVAAAKSTSRSLRLTAMGRRILKKLAQEYNLSEAGSFDVDPGIPMLGCVAAGKPMESFEQTDRLTLKEKFSTSSNIFALKVCGDSMIDESICDGDFVICRKSKLASNGTLVVASVGDAAYTLKRFYKEKKRIRLEAANIKYKPILTRDCSIIGVVVGLVRKFR